MSEHDDAESREWIDAVESVIAFEGANRIDQLLSDAVATARRNGARLPFAANTAYVNTIHPAEEPEHPGVREIEKRIRSIIRWNAAAIVLRANKDSSELGGHIALVPVRRDALRHRLHAFLARRRRRTMAAT